MKTKLAFLGSFLLNFLFSIFGLYNIGINLISYFYYGNDISLIRFIVSILLTTYFVTTTIDYYKNVKIIK